MKAIRAATAFIGGVTLAYASFSFAMWDMDPGNWSEFARANAAMIGVVVGGFLAIVFSSP